MSECAWMNINANHLPVFFHEGIDLTAFDNKRTKRHARNGTTYGCAQRHRKVNELSIPS